MLAVSAHAQAPSDSLARADSARRLGAVVVTAERTSAPLAASAAAVTRLSADELRRLPTTTVSGALELVPGIAVIHSDGLGDAPRLAIRGFYGGGETEYVTVLLDGVPLTGIATGQVNWDLVPLAALDAIEIVRGGASAAHGDAAVGGVVNLITRRGADDATWRRWRVDAGDRGVLRGAGAIGGTIADRSASVFGDLRRSTGFRAHEARTSGSLGGSLGLVDGPRGRLALSTLHHVREFEEPGPLPSSALSPRDRASPFFRFDQTHERLHRLGLDGARALARGRFSGYVTAERATGDAVRTVPLAAEFADTKQRDTRADRALGSLQYEVSALIGRAATRLVLGTDLSTGRLTTEYRGVAMGDSAAYSESSGETGGIEARGRGTRTGAAAFGNLEIVPLSRLRLTLGGRVDRIADRFEPRAPSEGETYEETHVAFSPRAGANVRYADGTRHTGHAYASVGRSFKAPTIDQLFDQRSVPVPFPPFAITTSNPSLDPQYGTSVEAGAYHGVALAPGLHARLAVSAYQIDMRDELDFDIESFRYVNIGRSRHRGVETGLTLEGANATSAFANVTRQSATLRYGENEGNRLKAVPGTILSAGVARAPARGVGFGATWTSVRGVFLDDANEIPLNPSSRFDVRASWGASHGRLVLGVRNVFGERYETTGFTDPGGSDERFLYPAAGRVVTVGVEGWR